MRDTQMFGKKPTIKNLVFIKTLTFLIVAVILSVDLLYVRDEIASFVVIDVVTQRKQNTKLKIVNTTSSEVSLLDVTAETIKQIQIGERIEIDNSLILCRTVSIKRQYSNLSQRILPGNVLTFVLNILAIVGFIDGLVNIVVQFFRSDKRSTGIRN